MQPENRDFICLENKERKQLIKTLGSYKGKEDRERERELVIWLVCQSFQYCKKFLTPKVHLYY